MKAQIDYFADCVFEYEMSRLEAQIKRKLAGFGYDV